MKITYLGTAAAEGCPALFCQCETCKIARIEGGKSIRTRSQALINDDLLIDFPADTYFHVLNYGLDLDKVKDVIITHSHDDHFYPQDFVYRMEGFCKEREPFVLQIYFNEACHEMMTDYINQQGYTQPFYKAVNLNQIEPFVEYTIGNYTVIPLLADHNLSEKSYIYAIKDVAGKAMLYANDTGLFPQESMEFIKGMYFDFISLDCTFGFLECERGHMGLNACAKMRDALNANGCADDNTKFVVHHFSHNANIMSHEYLAEKAAKMGFDVSYDGKILVI